MGFEKEIREQIAQGATELDILGNWLRSYDKDEIEFDELMERIAAYNGIFGRAYDVSPLENEGEGEDEGEDEESKVDELFGMKSEDEGEEKEKEQQQLLSMTEDKKNDIGRA